ncbi:alpha-galactosidase [Halodesulfovibrio sp.]|jgi:alpha-galactosidase|uniref:alpha-galactosidase n=1 Tax=Halodesulfovibrio sp. TaxID=1912772 RepID=UPI002600D603|nr:alpha-galactosidase [Halodesulfovibrio sp.]MCT4534444.1 alpha-galactosidase [Halodesulfovibrio sp.]
MARLTIIGAGSVMFTRQILSAAFAYPSLQNLELRLHDIDPDALKTTGKLVQKMIDQAKLPATVLLETDRRKALAGTDFVICSVQVGGLDAWYLDRDIPKRYGVDQEVGDTLGPGGIFRGLRHIPVLVELLRDMEEVCPDALLMNYANPLAPLVWAASQVSEIRTVGLCYGVTYTVSQLAGYLGVGDWVEHPSTPELWEQLMFVSVPDDFEFSFGGINHLCWVLEARYKGEDMQPAIRQLPENAKVYAADGVRCEMLKAFGYWCTENHWHCTDYVPYFRKTPEMINRFLPQRWNLMELEEQVKQRSTRIIADQLSGSMSIPLKRNALNAPKIMNAVVSGERIRINGNVPNRHEDGLLVENLPADCAVEVPVWVDENGLSPQQVGALPAQCAALCRTNTNVQELLVQAALTGDKDAVKHACMLDPVTATICTLNQISEMVDAMLSAEAKWLPQFS